MERSVACRTPDSIASGLGGSVVGLVILAGVGAAIYWYMRQSPAPPAPAATAPSGEAPPTPGTAPETAIRHPIPDALIKSGSQEPLPALDRSDGPLQAALVALVAQRGPRPFSFRRNRPALRVTIDNLPPKKNCPRSSCRSAGGGIAIGVA